METEQSYKSKEGIESIIINGISLGDVEGLRNEFQTAIQRLYSKKTHILSVRIRDSIKDQNQVLIRGYKDIVKCYELILELTLNKNQLNLLHNTF